MWTKLDFTDSATVKMAMRIRSLPATGLAGFIHDATGMLARGEVDVAFADWIDVALARLDELADELANAAAAPKDLRL